MRPIENRESEYLYLMLAAQWRHRSSPSFYFYFYMNEHRFLVLFFPLLSRVMQRLMAPQIAGRIEGSFTNRTNVWSFTGMDELMLRQ